MLSKPKKNWAKKIQPQKNHHEPKNKSHTFGIPNVGNLPKPPKKGRPPSGT